MPKFSFLSVLVMVSTPGITVVRVALNQEVQVAAAAAVVIATFMVADDIIIIIIIIT